MKNIDPNQFLQHYPKPSIPNSIELKALLKCTKYSLLKTELNGIYDLWISALGQWVYLKDIYNCKIFYDNTSVILNDGYHFKKLLKFRFQLIDSTIIDEEIEQIFRKMYEASFRLENEAIEDLYELKQNEDSLFYPTWFLLSLGADDRSQLKRNRVQENYPNKYGTTTIPKKFINRSNCTSSSIDEESMAKIEIEHYKLILEFIRGNNNSSELFNKITSSIFSYFNLDLNSKAEQICLTPSGTDVEFLCTWIALQRAKSRNEDLKVHIIIIAELEVGSGTIHASLFNHFSSQLPSGMNSSRVFFSDDKGMSALKNKLILSKINIRNETGELIHREDVEQNLGRVVSQAIMMQDVVLLHYVPSTKTGQNQVSLEFIRNLKNIYSDQLIIVADAAQGRFKKNAIRDFLKMGINVSFTGSKFYCSSPFCGALIMTESESLTFQNTLGEVPKSFGHYFDNTLFYRMPKNENNESYWTNWGLCLRWMQAIHTMDIMQHISDDFIESLILIWSEGVKKIIKNYPQLILCDLQEEQFLDWEYLYPNSIVTFKVCSKMSDQKSFFDEIYMAIQKANEFGDQCYEIGRPVHLALTKNGNSYMALRSALGAKSIIKAYQLYLSSGFSSAINFLLLEDELVFAKLSKLIDNKNTIYEYANEKSFSIEPS